MLVGLLRRTLQLVPELEPPVELVGHGCEQVRYLGKLNLRETSAPCGHTWRLVYWGHLRSTGLRRLLRCLRWKLLSPTCRRCHRCLEARCQCHCERFALAFVLLLLLGCLLLL